MEDFPQEDEANDQYINKQILSTGDFFGAIDSEEFGLKSSEIQNFFLSVTGCQIAVFTKQAFVKLRHREPEIFEKLKAGFQS